MRYFLNTSAAKPIVAGGYTFTFELVGLRGGSWLGVLAVAEPAASILADFRAANTDEISEAKYDSEKKKQSATLPPSPSSRLPTPPEQGVAIADRVGSLTRPADSSPVNPNSTANISAVSLLTTGNSPPAEPMLAKPVKRRSFKT